VLQCAHTELPGLIALLHLTYRHVGGIMEFSQNITHFFWHFIKRQKLAFGLIVAAALIWAINEAIFPYLVKLIVNGVYAHQDTTISLFAILVKPLMAILVFWLIMEFAMRVQGVLAMRAFPTLRAHIRETAFSYIQKHSYNYFATHFAGSVANKLNDLASSSERIVELMVFTFISIFIMLLVALVLMWDANPVFGALLLVWVMVHTSVSVIFIKRGSKLAEAHAESTSTLNGKIMDIITNIISVRVFARYRAERDYVHYYQRQEIDKTKASLWHLEKMKMLLGIAGLLFVFSTMFCLVYGWQHHWLSIGDFTLVSMLMFNMLGMVWFTSFQMTVFVRELSKVRVALLLITTQHEVRDRPDAQALVVKKGEITFDNVTFAYHKGQAIFSDLTVNIAAGQKIGLVGYSGAGKTTFVNLLLRFYDVDGGVISIDGQNVADVQLDSLYQQIAMIPQDPSLFHRSLMENIRYGSIDASDEAVLKAAKLAHCHEFISQLEAGYDTLVGERGIRLSGGQRQRIAIARAILKDAPIFVLDEATSSLDSVTEKLIQESLALLMKSRTTIVIAHRLSTLAGMDRIIVFDQGRIIEDGSIDHLLAAKGHFANLWQRQRDGFLPEYA